MLAYPLSAAAEPSLDEREAKFLPGAEEALAFWALASEHLRPPDKNPFCYARTTYFDTADLLYYRSSGRRLRVREYASAEASEAPPLVGERCYVELKQSAGGRRAKTRVALHAGEVPAKLLALAEGPVHACVATWYRRRALVDPAGTLRVTLDDELRLCRPKPLGAAATLSAHDILAEGPAFVLEFKSWAAPPPWLQLALAGLQEAVGFSKFMLGMRAVVAARPERGERQPDGERERDRELDRRLLSVRACTG